MNHRLLTPFIAIAALLVLLQLSAFTVSEGEYAVRTRFGQVQQAN